MVFESIVTDVLNSVLGDYIENLDRKQLKIGIWGGDVVLKNLKIRENALDEMDLPVRLIYGSLGKLVLKIPWKNLYSQPVIVDIDSLFALIAPKQASPYDPEKEAKYEAEAKQAALKALSESIQKELDKNAMKPDRGFAEKLTAQLVNNLQVKISNVHLRYEDTITTDTVFSIGVSLHELELCTTNENWERCYMSQPVSRVYKLANLSCLSVYMNCNARQYSLEQQADMRETLKCNIARRDYKPTLYNYILGPISCNAKLKLNMNPEYDTPPFEIAKIDLSLEMEKLNIGLTSTQFQNVLKLADEMNRMQLGARYRKYRPYNIPYKGNYKEWWNFAITSMLEDVRSRRHAWCWTYIKEHRDRCNTYRETYREQQLSKKPSVTIKETIDLLEQKLDLFNLVLIRQQVDIEIAKIRENEAQQATVAAGWFSGWFGSAKKEEDDSKSLAKQFQAAMTTEEKAKLYKAIGYQEQQTPLNVPETYEAIKLNFKLIALEIGLYDDSQNQSSTMRVSHDYQDLPSIILLNFSMATCTVSQRPAANAISITAGMKEIKMTGLTEKDFVPTIIESQISDEFNLLDIFFETNPIDHGCDQRIKLVLRPLIITYDAKTILRLFEVFTPPKVQLSTLENVASTRIVDFKERSATGMQYIIDNHPLLDADILFMPNILIIPQSGQYIINQKPLIVVSLGQLHIVSKSIKRSQNTLQEMFNSGEDQASILKTVMDNAYDKFNIVLDNVQVLVVTPNEPWQDALSMHVSTEMHLLQPITIEVTAAICVFGDDPRLPKTKIDCVVPQIQLNFTEDRIYQALSIVFSLPLPTSEPEAMPDVLRKSTVSIGSSMTNFLTRDTKKLSTAPKIPIVDEIVQYTKLEFNFALKDLSVVLYQSLNIDESYTESPDYGTPIEEQSERSSFESPTSLLDVVKIRNSQQLLILQVLQLEAHMAQRTFEMVAIAKLGAINVKQYACIDKVEESVDIIDTPGYSQQNEYLLTISYTNADKISPEFTTKYNSTEQLMIVNFSTLNIKLHQEYLMCILELAHNFQKNFEKIRDPVSKNDRVGFAGEGDYITRLTTIAEEGFSSAKPTSIIKQKGHNKHAVVESIQLRIIANLSQVGLYLTSRKRPLASMQVQQFDAGFVVKKSYTELNLGLKNITVTDLNPHTIHKNILSIVGNEALNCQVIMYNLDETKSYNSDDMKITVDIGCMKIMFLNWFVTGVMNFLNNFQAAQEALVYASTAAAETAAQNALGVYQKSSRIKLKMNIKAPIIVIPIDSNSLSAVALDLGSLTLTNVISELYIESKEQIAIQDDIKLELKDMKLTKAEILTDTPTPRSGVDNSEAAYGIKTGLNIMKPISMTVHVRRNLSSGWYKEIPEIEMSGRLKSIELSLYMDDYALIMSILNRNFQEGYLEFPRHEAFPTPAAYKEETLYRSSTKRFTELTRRIEVPIVHEQLKFSFQFDGVVLNLMESTHVGFARFGIYFLAIKGNKLEDGTLSTSIVLCNIQLNDMRPSSKSQINQYLSRKDWTTKGATADIIEACYEEQNYMVDAVLIIKENNTYVKVRVAGFEMIVCIDFLLKLSSFMTLPVEAKLSNEFSNISIAEPQLKRAESITNLRSIAHVGSAIVRSQSIINVKEEHKITLTLDIDEPDIILVESLNDLNTNAIIFNAQANIKYRSIDDKKIINGEVSALKMYMCSFLPEKREATKHYILHPCVISLYGSTPDEEGLNISLKVSDIIINVSPATIELFNKAMISLNTESKEMLLFEKKKDFSQIWEPRRFKEKDYWFIKIDKAEEAEEELFNYKTENCVIEMPCITLVIESGVGYYTTPLISVDTQLNAVVSNWSQNLGVNGSLALSMKYFNQNLAEWEPIIELNEHINQNGISEYLPWELIFKLQRDTVQSEFDENVEMSRASIAIQSDNNLEITLSKSCVTLIRKLGEAFSQAIDETGLIKPVVIAPFVLENDTGFDITIDFSRGVFTLHDIHMPKTQVLNSLNTSLIFQTGTPTSQVKPDEIKLCTISSGGRAYLQTKDLSMLSSEVDEEYNIYVKIGDIAKYVSLPVSKSVNRYYSLMRATNQDPWGIISEVTCEYGTTKINIHGILNVHNHFTTKVQIYRRKPHSNEMLKLGEIDPDEIFHVPLHAIYAESKDLYFSLPGYKTSIQGIRWNDTPSDLQYHKQLQCDPVKTYEPLYVNVSREKTECYFEHTNKFKILSAFYTLHLRPPLYLRNALPITIRVSVAGCSVRENEPELPAEVDLNLDSIKSNIISSTTIRQDFLDYGEKDVKPGDILHLPTIQLTSKSANYTSFLVVRLLQYLEKNWSCTTEIEKIDDFLSVWKFSSYDSAVPMNMELFVRYNNRYGSLVLTIYSPFWFINKTDLMLTYKTDLESVEVLYHPPEYSGPILFAFRDNAFFDKKKASIRVENGAWSEKIPLDVAGSKGGVTCKVDGIAYQIGVHNHLTQNSLTKIITFIPFYIIRNKCHFPIQLQEQTRPGDQWLNIPSNDCVPFWPKDEDKQFIIVRVDRQCTAAFSYTDVTCTLLKLDNEHGGINVDVQATEGGVYITFTAYSESDAPGLLINHTKSSILYYEKNTKIEHKLKPNHCVLYAWHNPIGDQRLVFGKNKQETDLKRDAIGELILRDGNKAYWVTFLDGLQRVLLFTEIKEIAEKSESSAALQTITQTIKLRIHGIGLSVVNNENGVDIMYLGITSSGIIWESRKENKKRFKQMSIHETALMEGQYQQYLIDKGVDQRQQYILDNKYPIDFENMRLKKSSDRIIKRSFYPGIWMSIKSSPFQNQFHLKVYKVQLDNQLLFPIFPVVLAPIAPPKSVATKTSMKPFIECSVVERIIPNSVVKQYKYACLLIQEFHFKVDLIFLTGIADLFSTTETDLEAAIKFWSDVESIENRMSDFFETYSAQEQKNFYDNLHLGPLKIHVSFSLAGSDTKSLPGFLGPLVEGVGVTLTDVNDVVFRLAFFEREYQFFTQQQLISEITSHYTGQALKQLYVLVLGLDVLGNPYGLVVGFKKGVEDLFYEPFQGAIQGPGEFAEGLVLGVKSLFGHTVGGAAGAMSKITGAMGKGLAALTFDEEYQRKRRQALNNKPKSFQEGIARSGKGLVMGFVDGVTGVVTKPVNGARQEGVEGFFKGLGKGAIGLVARPTAGVVDFASGSFEAVKRATEAGDEVKRLRPARFLHQDNVLRPYCLKEAKGNSLLKEIEKGKYSSTDSFVYCEEIVKKREFLIISNYRVIYVTHNEMFGNWTVNWTHLLTDIVSVSHNRHGVEIKLQKESKKMLGILGPREPQNKLVVVPLQAKREKLVQIIESQRN